MDVGYAFIPSGKNHVINGQLRHNLMFNDKSLLENIINEVLDSGLNVITTVRESYPLKKRYKTDDRVVVIESRESLVDSSIYGLMEGLVNGFELPKFRGIWNSIHDVRKYIKNNPAVMDLPILYFGSDSPFFKKEVVESFVKRYKNSQTDIYIGLSDMEELRTMDRRLKLNLREMDSTLTNSIETDKGSFRPNNLYIIKPFKMISKGLAGAYQKIYDYRELSKRKTLTSHLGVLSGMVATLCYSLRHPMMTAHFVKDVHLAVSHVGGKKNDRLLNISDVIKHATRVINTSINVDLEGGLRPLLDIDDDDSYLKFRENYALIEYYLRGKNN